MTRVSENSSTAAVQHSMKKAKLKLEDLQLKGSTLKKLSKPSDNPMASMESLTIGSNRSDTTQYLANCNHAMLNLEGTEKSLEQLSEILMKAKEIAIGQASGFYNSDVRSNISNEVQQLHRHALAIANKRIGARHIFAGHDTLKPPFSERGEYLGDKGKITLEISKDFFIPINLDGMDVFYTTDTALAKIPNPINEIKSMTEGRSLLENSEGEDQIVPDGRAPASIDPVTPDSEKFVKKNNIFSQLSMLATALENNDHKAIQGLLEDFDDSLTRIITLRTRIGSTMNTVDIARGNLESDDVAQATRRSYLQDADISELFSDLTKQQDVLKTTYKASSSLINKNLLEFIR